MIPSFVPSLHRKSRRHFRCQQRDDICWTRQIEGQHNEVVIIRLRPHRRESRHSLAARSHECPCLSVTSTNHRDDRFKSQLLCEDTRRNSQPQSHPEGGIFRRNHPPAYLSDSITPVAKPRQELLEWSILQQGFRQATPNIPERNDPNASDQHV